MSQIIKYWNLGRVQYDYSNKIQKFLSKNHGFKDLTKERKKNHEMSLGNTILFMEHEPVYTTGLRDCLDEADQRKLLSLGAQYRQVDRGGLATFHGPGQLMAYPVLALRSLPDTPGARWYVCALETAVILTCHKLGIKAGRSPHTGVWVGDNKICAIGIHISRGITSHGIALNCSTDLSWFSHISPCGVHDKGVTSVSRQLNKTTTIEDVLPLLCESFEEVFACKLMPYSKQQQQTVLSLVDS